MMRLSCPHCGVRDETEFRFGGQSHIARPRAAISDREWTEYLFVRENPCGIHYERWLHAAGCRRWFNVARNTVTHEVLAVYAMTDPKPMLEAAQ